MALGGFGKDNGFTYANRLEENRNLLSNTVIEFEINRPRHGFSGFTLAMQLASSKVVEILSTELGYPVGRILRQTYSNSFMTGFRTKQRGNGFSSLITWMMTYHSIKFRRSHRTA